MRNFSQVYLVCQLAQHRALHIFGCAEAPAGECPATQIRMLRTLPKQHLKRSVPDLKHGGEHFVSHCRLPAGNISHVFDCKAKTG
jgi:hypothetical protein